MTRQSVCVLGGCGFIGSHLVNELNKNGYRVHVLTRRRERHKALAVLPNLRMFEGDAHDPAVLDKAIAGCSTVVNLIAILNERRGENFRQVHVELPQKIVTACKKHAVDHLVHMSALNADARNGPSRYLRSKGEGEDLVHGAAGDTLRVNSFRPSVVFGPGDHLFGRFAGILKMSPGIVPLACPEARFAPVFVDDLVAGMVATIAHTTWSGKRFEVCGPKTYTLLELLEYTNKILGTRRVIIGLNRPLSRLLAGLMSVAPGKPLTPDNVRSLSIDSVCRNPDNAPPVPATTPVEAVVPFYLGQQHFRSHYDRFRHWARRYV